MSGVPEIPVGAAEGCDLLTLPFQKQDQKIAAFGSSYMMRYRPVSMASAGASARN